MPSMPIVTRDSRSGVFSVDIDVGEVARTAQFDDSHLVDLDADGRVLSVEILTPDDPKIEEIAAQFGFEDRVPEILAAIEEAFAPRVETVGGGFTTIQGVSRSNGGDDDLVGGRSQGNIPPREITLA